MELSVSSTRIVAEKDELASAEGQLFARRILFGVALVIAVIVPLSVLNTWRENSESGVGLLELILSVAPAVMIIITAPFFLRNSFQTIAEGEIVRLEIDLRRRTLLYRTRTIDEAVERYKMLSELSYVALVDTSTEDLPMAGIVFGCVDRDAPSLLTLDPSFAVELWDAAYTLLREPYPRIQWFDTRPNKMRRQMPTENMSMMARRDAYPALTRRPYSTQSEACSTSRAGRRYRPSPEQAAGSGPSRGTPLQSLKSAHRYDRGTRASAGPSAPRSQTSREQ